MRAGSRKGGKEGRDQEARIHSSRSVFQGGGEGMKGERREGRRKGGLRQVYWLSCILSAPPHVELPQRII